LTDQKGFEKSIKLPGHNQLPQAEHNARQQALKGALYQW